jgi:hypothetical protein
MPLFSRRRRRCRCQFLTAGLQKMTTFATSMSLSSIKSSGTYPLRVLRCRKSLMPSTCGESPKSRGNRCLPFHLTKRSLTDVSLAPRIGNSRSVTALHKDNYENIYVQIQGQKHFVLLPPHCYPCVNEKSLRPATYVRNVEDGQLQLVMDGSASDESCSVPFAIWDPDQPHKNATPYSKLAEPLRVTLQQGDMLYLPAMW